MFPVAFPSGVLPCGQLSSACSDDGGGYTAGSSSEHDSPKKTTQQKEKQRKSTNLRRQSLRQRQSSTSSAAADDERIGESPNDYIGVPLPEMEESFSMPSYGNSTKPMQALTEEACTQPLETMFSLSDSSMQAESSIPPSIQETSAADLKVRNFTIVNFKPDHTWLSNIIFTLFTHVLCTIMSSACKLYYLCVHDSWWLIPYPYRLLYRMASFWSYSETLRRWRESSPRRTESSPRRIESSPRRIESSPRRTESSQNQCRPWQKRLVPGPWRLCSHWVIVPCKQKVTHLH